jgi:hypothetical protein
MTPDAIERFGEEFSRFMGVYAYRDIQSGETTISLDNARFMNHHNHPVDIYFRMGGARYRRRRGIDLRLDSYWEDPLVLHK